MANLSTPRQAAGSSSPSDVEVLPSCPDGCPACEGDRVANDEYGPGGSLRDLASAMEVE